MQLFLLLFLIALTGTMWGRGRYLKIYAQESKNLIASRVTGAGMAEAILRNRGIEGVTIVRGRGILPDFYEPETRRITLAPQHFGGCSYCAIALASLQAGKAIQHHERHRAILWRTTSVRWTVFLSLPLFLIGLLALLLGMGKTVFPAVILIWSLVAFWNFLTVPTEIDAGLRAKRDLEELRAFRNLDERVGVERVLGAAGTAYIDGISVLGSWVARTILPWARAKAG